MYQAITSILGAVFISLIWVYIIKAPIFLYKITKIKIGKPLNCGFCMAFWLCFFYMLLKTNLMDSIFISSIAPFLFLYVEDFITNKWEL
jgi:hypothetical protein